MSRTDTPLPGRPAAEPSHGPAELRFQRVAAIFERARMAAASEREDLLLRECALDAELLIEVRSLLAHHDVGVDALDGCVIRPGVGARIGRYRIEGTLGEGGMGTVYRATQLEPVRREVALKVIKLGMDTRQVVRRFEAERQALARLEHTNVAKVLDGGATPDGRPYFVMELVRGSPITQHCDERRIEWRDRVALMVEVCSAVHHAHQRGILHRDLKPSNILVTEADGKAIPKIIDFGVAKALEPGVGMTAASLSTALGHVVGTPDYMSPEQAAGEDVDTRTDVFALGIVLYELLAGVTPVRARSMSGRRTPSPMELRRRLLEDDPPRVSSAIDEERAGARRTTAAALGRALRGEIDWIVLKAIARDPARRYASVAALADDLERLLANEPVAARPPSTGYILAKFARRHTVALVAGLAVVFSLMIGTTVSLFGLRSAQAERDVARDAEREQTRLAAALRGQLFASDVERGRKAARQGNWTEAWQLLYGAIEADPESPHARWALRESAWEQGWIMTHRFDSKVRFARFLPDGQHLFAAETERPPVLLDMLTGEARPLGTGGGADVLEVAVSRDGRYGFTSDTSGLITQWDLVGNEPPKPLVSCHPNRGSCSVLCDPSADVAYAGGRNGVIWRIEYLADPPIVQAIAHSGGVKRLAIAADGMLAVGDDQGGLLLLSLDRQREVRLQPHERSIQSLAFGRAGRLVATGTTGPTIVINDTETGEVVQTVRSKVGTARNLRFGPDDRTLLVLGWWGLHEINLVDGAVTTLIPFGSWRFDVAPDEQTIAMTSADYRMLSIWNIGPDRGGVRGVVPAKSVTSVSAMPNEPFLAAMNRGIAALDERGRPIWHMPVRSARLVVPGPRSPIVAVIGNDRWLRVFDTVNRKSLATSAMPNVRQDSSCVDLVEDRFVAHGTTENAVELIDLKNGSRCEVIPSGPSELLALAISDDGAWLGASFRGDDNRLIRLADGAETTFHGNTTGFAVDFNADSRFMLVGTWRGDLLVHDVQTGELRALVGHSSMVKVVAAHPTDPDLALSMSEDGSVRIWHLGLMREVAMLRPFPRLEWDANSIRSAGWVNAGEGIGIIGIEGELATYSIPMADRVIGQWQATPSINVDVNDP
ncbi:MAG: protein kinase [Phycisphaerae bacterium]|nr:protein kinase [Phycisphaerae bacterium]